MPSLASLIHLSDIHLRESGNIILSRIRALAAGICEADQRCRSFVVILSGDIAQAGSSAEYEIAHRMVRSMADEISRHRPGSVVHWIAVPGNHDCILPEGERQLRAVLIEGILPTLREAPNAAILEQLLQKQHDYFHFSQQLFGFPANDAERLCGTRVVEVEGKKIAFALYNTALLSKRDEEQGLQLPLNTIRSNTPSSDYDVRVSVFHHPYVWLDPNDSIAFRDHVEMSSEIALTGHQHVPYGFAKQNLDGQSVLYLEGHVLQDPSIPSQSGFRVIVLDFEQAAYKLVSYHWSKSFYEASVESDYKSLPRPNPHGSTPAPSQELMALLSNSGIGLSHNVKGPLSLDTLYVYPDSILRKSGSFESYRHLPGSSLPQYISNGAKIAVTGPTRSGKTALAKMLCREWIRSRQFYPLLISGKSIEGTTVRFFEELLKREIITAYGPEELSKYRQLPTPSKALLIDDWDESPLSVEAQSTLLRLASSYFGKVVLFGGSIVLLEHLLHKIDGENELFAYDFLAIQPLSFVARGQIIDKWMALELSPSSREFTRRVEEAERLIDTVIGRNTLPSIPFIVIALLEASQHNIEMRPDSGSFGYLYEVLITGALNTTLGKNPQLDRKYTFLSLLAFRLFSERTEILPVQSVKQMLDEYASDWIIKLDKDSLLADLEYAQILVRRDGHYTFA